MVFNRIVQIVNLQSFIYSYSMMPDDFKWDIVYTWLLWLKLFQRNYFWAGV